MYTLTNILGMSSSPARNIAIEEGLRAVVATDLATGMSAGYFAAYANTACIVLGRNQEAAAELSPVALATGAPRVYRRTSGGGTVYHDEGNLNWAFVVPGTLADRAGLLRLVVGALTAAGGRATVGGRGEVTAAGRKIGGTAAAAGNGVLLFHGTLLVNTDLAALQACLAAHTKNYRAGSVRSVPSAVGNLRELAPGLTVEALAQMLASAIAGRVSAAWKSLVDMPLVEVLTQELSSDAWIYERSLRIGRGVGAPS